MSRPTLGNRLGFTFQVDCSVEVEEDVEDEDKVECDAELLESGIQVEVLVEGKLKGDHEYFIPDEENAEKVVDYLASLVWLNYPGGLLNFNFLVFVLVCLLLAKEFKDDFLDLLE